MFESQILKKCIPQECIPVGCVPPAAVAIPGGLHQPPPHCEQNHTRLLKCDLAPTSLRAVNCQTYDDLCSDRWGETGKKNSLEIALNILNINLAVRTAYHEAGWRHPKEIAVTTRATINDIPVPQGSWKEGFDKRNKTWNMYFAAGLVTLSVTLYVVTILINNV